MTVAIFLDALIGVAGMLAALTWKIIMLDLSKLYSRQDSNLHVTRS